MCRRVRKDSVQAQTRERGGQVKNEEKKKNVEWDGNGGQQVK